MYRVIGEVCVGYGAAWSSSWHIRALFVQVRDLDLILLLIIIQAIAVE
jgi:hypothetical protein